MTASAPTSAVGTLGGRPNSSWESDDGSRAPEEEEALSWQEVEEALSWEEEEMPLSWEESWAEETLSCRPQTPLERGLQTPLESGGIVARAHSIMLMTSGSRGLTRLIGVWRRPGRRARPNRR